MSQHSVTCRRAQVGPHRCGEGERLQSLGARRFRCLPAGNAKKQQDQQPKEERPQQQPGAGAGLLMETTMESGNFSSASVDGSKLEVPAGFKQVESEMMKRRGR